MSANKVFLLLSTAFLCSKVATSQIFFEQANDFLNREVVFGLVDYESIKAKPEPLDSLIAAIDTMSLTNRSKDFVTSFYINAYNLLVIKAIAKNYPIAEPFEVPGFFDDITHKIAGEQLTLDNIEFKKLFEPTQDPRIHFALGCGARSCPFLYDGAFVPDQLQGQLEERAHIILEKPNYVYVDDKRKSVTLSKIFKWYSEQFTTNAGSLLGYVNKYRKNPIPENYLIRFHEYDWSVNSQ